MATNAPLANPHEPTRGRRSVWKLHAGVFVVLLAVYVLTCQRGPAWQDSGIFQWRILRFDLVGWLGLALSHPLLILLGKAFSQLPFGPLAWRMNLVSAVCGALAGANVAVLVRRLMPSHRAPAWFAAGLFGLAHTTWWLSTICESQAILAALFTLELNVLLSLSRRPRGHVVLLLGGLSGLALTAHNLALLAVPVYALAVVGLCLRRRLRWYAVGLFAVGWAVGSAGLVVLVVRQAMDTGLVPAVQSALFGVRWRSDVLGGSLRAAGMGVGFVAYNFPNAGLPLAVAGLLALRHRPGRLVFRAFAALAGIYLLFAIRYSVPDQFMFFLPFYAMVAVLAGVGLGRLAERGANVLAAVCLASVLIAPAVYAAMPSLARAVGLALPGRKDLPFRDPASYWLCPWKATEDSAGLFARAALAEVPPDGIVIADGTSLYPLLWVRHRGGISARPALVGIGEATTQRLAVGTPNVFAVSSKRGYYPEWLDEVARLRKDGKESVLFRVVWREAPGTAPGRDPGRQDIRR